MKYVACILIGFFLGVLTTVGVVMISGSLSPKIPVIAKPASITIFLHPFDGHEVPVAKGVQIPAERQDDVFRRLEPGLYYGNIYEKVSPLVAEAFITHTDKTQTRVLVREGGVNPAIVSVDGVNYFYAKNEPDVYAGAIELIRIVVRIAQSEQSQSKVE